MGREELRDAALLLPQVAARAGGDPLQQLEV